MYDKIYKAGTILIWNLQTFKIEKKLKFDYKIEKIFFFDFENSELIFQKKDKIFYANFSTIFFCKEIFEFNQNFQKSLKNLNKN